MEKELIQLLRHRDGLRKANGRILRQSDSFFKNMPMLSVTKTQMAAVRDKVRHAASFEEAVETTGAFLDHQMKKLKSKADEGKPESWMTPAGKGKKKPLGECVKDYIAQERYLDGLAVDKQNLDRLDVLRCFWNNVHDQYHYKKTFGENMPLQEVKS
jgi:hypothetical protein